MALGTQKQRFAALATPLGDDKLLLEALDGTEALSRPFRYELLVLSENGPVNPDDLLGQNATVRMEVPDATRYFNGFVSQFTQLECSGKIVRYKMVLVPWLWFLTRTADCRIFQNISVPDLLKQIFRDRGISDFEDALTATYSPREYIVQYRETEFNFVSRLMETEGIHYFFKHENGKHTLVLADTGTLHETCPGAEEVPFRPPGRATLAYEHLYEWLVDSQVQPGVYAHTDFDFKKPKSDLKALANVARQHALADLEIFDYPGAYTAQADGDAYAKVRIQELQAQHEIVRARGTVHTITPGFRFKLIQHQDPAQEKEYLITSATYRLRSDNYTTGRGGRAGGSITTAAGNLGDRGLHSAEGNGHGHGLEDHHFLVALTAIDAKTPFAPPRITPKPVVQGPQTAIVVGKTGEEIWTDQHARVKVMFHWDRYSKADETSSCWIRVAQVWAGKQWGGMFIPRIGQEVIVDFLEGDPDQPIITGRVYNGECTPPQSLPANATISTLKSDSSKGHGGFNEFRFEDKKSHEQVFLHAQNRLDIRVRGSYYETNYGNREVRVGWEKDGQRGGDYNTFIRHDVNYHVQEGQYAQIEKKFHEKVQEDVVQSFEKNQTSVVDQQFAFNSPKWIVETGQLISFKTDKFRLEVASDTSLKAGEFKIESTKAVSIRADAIKFEANQAISMKVGGNFVVIDVSGVSINGTMLNLNSGGSAQAPDSPDAVEAFVPPQIELPLDAAPASTGTPGTGTGVGGRARTRQVLQLVAHRAPPYVPPPKGPPGPFQPPPTPKLDPCCIQKLEVFCSHKSRKAGPTNCLQVVADNAYRNAQFSIKFAGAIELSGKKGWGGNDTVTANVQSDHPKKHQTALVRYVGSPAEDDWQGGATRKVTIDAVKNDEFWPSTAAPDVYYLFGRTCDDTTQLVTIESFPSQQYELELNISVLGKQVEKIKSLFEDKLKGKVGPVSLEPKFNGPQGNLNFKWGWREFDDWRACFVVEVTAGLKPIIGFGVEVQVSLLNIAMTVGFSAIGIPTPIASKLSDLATEYLADAFVFIGVEFNIAMTGSARVRWFVAKGDGTPSEDCRVEGQLTSSVEGKLSVGIAARLGSKHWLNAECRGKGTTGLTLEGALEIKREGVFLGPTLKCQGLTLSLTLCVKCGETDLLEKNAAWQPFGEEPLWQPDPAKLVGFED